MKDREIIPVNITSRKYMEKKLEELVQCLEESLLDIAEWMES
ncbi:MAG: hypothetical protein AB2421_05725 [Thermotaleaceae bacterium]